MSIAAKHSRTAALVGLRYWVYPARLAVGQRLVEPAAPGRDDLVLYIFNWELSAQAMAVLNSECFPNPPP